MFSAVYASTYLEVVCSTGIVAKLHSTTSEYVLMVYVLSPLSLQPRLYHLFDYRG